MFKVKFKALIFAILFSLSVAKTENVATISVTENIKDFITPHIVNLNRDNQSDSAKNSASRDASAGFARTARARSSSTVKELFACAISLDASCVVDRVEDFVDNANQDLLREADVEARQFSGRKEEAPSSLLATIASLLMEVPELLRDSFNGFLKSGALEVRAADEEEDEDESTKDKNAAQADDDDDNDDDEDDDEDDEDTSEDDDDGAEEEKNDVAGMQDKKDENVNNGVVQSKENGWVYLGRKKCGKKGNCGGGNDDDDDDGGEDYSNGTAGRKAGGGGRGKKKKKKKAITKLLLLGLVIKAKITLLLKLLAAKLQIKFLFIALANLLINLARFWWDLKKGHGNEQPQKVIYYEHAQHQHHYDGAEDWQSSSPGGGGYWARAYENEEDNKKAAQDLAYSKHAPDGTIYSRIDDKPNISWNPSRKLFVQK